MQGSLSQQQHPTSARHTRILIADDNEGVRKGIKLMLCDEGWEICGEARDGKEAVQKAGELGPDLILLDVSMPVLGGLAAAPLLRQLVPHVKILLMSHHDTARLLPAALEAGAHACIDKSELGADLVGAIKLLLQTE